ncbi:MAG TPA: sulfite exporter TauE/SafE family protein [Steroidobacteraceae bacterium]|nr:sulfite exporter TauE/SafE family protein [Steroidobacteraceae bacterium]
MHTDPLFYAVAVPAVIILGLAKGGLAGLGMLAVPLMSLVVSPVEAATIVLPILLVQDVVSVWAFRKAWDGRSLAIMLPGAAVGIGLGYLLAARVSTAAVEFAVGLTSIVFGLQQLWKTWRGALEPRHASDWIGVACGVGAGFTSQIAHAGGPPFQLYMLPKHLPRDVFVGTSAIFFAVVNWLKVPAYVALGQFTSQNLHTAAVLLPLAVASTIGGVWVIRRISGPRFYFAMYLLLVLVGARLTWSGLGALVH